MKDSNTPTSRGTMWRGDATVAGDKEREGEHKNLVIFKEIEKKNLLIITYIYI